MNGIAQFRTTVLDCADTMELAQFYSRLLGWAVLDGSDEEWAVITDGGPPARLGFQQVADYRPPVWPGVEHPQQVHIDVTVDDMDKAEAAVLEIGATKHEYQPSEGDTFRVFLDPAGHPFCLCR
ncbi:VOC family protein [Nonomuraea guangzhouensis]|uniref:VOC family protein n=1 Tax=Nonomuraea guangzhouensis TaxID=1291555 RepID=A0ABW4GS06_9ACTN|nr:VOC family protein [Nonomuraea guangzhouensis]